MDAAPPRYEEPCLLLLAPSPRPLTSYPDPVPSPTTPSPPSFRPISPTCFCVLLPRRHTSSASESFCTRGTRSRRITSRRRHMVSSCGPPCRSPPGQGGAEEVARAWTWGGGRGHTQFDGCLSDVGIQPFIDHRASLSTAEHQAVRIPLEATIKTTILGAFVSVPV